MRARISSIFLALALAIVVAAPAAALIPCVECEPSTPGGTRCAAFCQGQFTHTCAEWLASSCSDLRLLPAGSRTAEVSEDAFIRSLRAEPVEQAAGESPDARS